MPFSTQQAELLAINMLTWDTKGPLTLEPISHVIGWASLLCAYAYDLLDHPLTIFALLSSLTCMHSHMS